MILGSCCENNFHVKVQMWNEKRHLVNHVDIGDYISIFPVITATYNKRKYVNSCDETVVQVSYRSYMVL